MIRNVGRTGRNKTFRIDTPNVTIYYSKVATIGRQNLLFGLVLAKNKCDGEAAGAK
jgi:hypothetical protein